MIKRLKRLSVLKACVDLKNCIDFYRLALMYSDLQKAESNIKWHFPMNGTNLQRLVLTWTELLWPSMILKSLQYNINGFSWTSTDLHKIAQTCINLHRLHVTELYQPVCIHNYIKWLVMTRADLHKLAQTCIDFQGLAQTCS